jgi:hypothetical protein
MIYGHKKAIQMARDGLACGTRDYARPPRAAARQTLHRFLDGDEDADINHDEYAQAHRSDWDGYAYCTSAMTRWATDITADVADPKARFEKLRGVVRSPTIQYHLGRALKHSDEFSTNRIWRDWHPRWTTASWTAREDARTDRRVRVLEEIVESGWGHRLLNRSISHSMVMWEVWTKDAPTQVPDGVSHRMKTVLRDRFVLTNKGPASARKLLGLGDVQDFISDLHKASRNAVVTVEPYIVRSVCPTRYHYWNENITRHTYVRESFNTTRTNPDYHPEWLKSVDAFVDAWVACAGDPKELKKKYPWG